MRVERTNCWKSVESMSAVASAGTPSMKRIGLGSEPCSAVAGPVGAGPSSSESSSIASESTASTRSASLSPPPGPAQRNATQRTVIVLRLWLNLLALLLLRRVLVLTLILIILILPAPLGLLLPLGQLLLRARDGEARAPGGGLLGGSAEAGLNGVDGFGSLLEGGRRM